MGAVETWQGKSQGWVPCGSGFPGFWKALCGLGREETALTSGMKAPGPAPWFHYIWLAVGAMVGQGQPGQSSWQRQIRLTANQDNELVPVLRQVEGIQPKYLTLVIAKTGKHLHKTLLLKENRETNFLLFLLKIFPCIPLLGNMPMEDWGWLVFIPLSSWESQNNQLCSPSCAVFDCRRSDCSHGMLWTEGLYGFYVFYGFGIL